MSPADAGWCKAPEVEKEKLRHKDQGERDHQNRHYCFAMHPAAGMCACVRCRRKEKDGTFV